MKFRMIYDIMVEFVCLEGRNLTLFKGIDERRGKVLIRKGVLMHFPKVS